MRAKKTRTTETKTKAQVGSSNVEKRVPEESTSLGLGVLKMTSHL